jgi:spermidine synthase
MPMPYGQQPYGRQDDRQEDRQPIVLDRAEGTAGGELVLRRVGADFEIISNGVFLMDTRGGTSERLLVRAALDRIGGTGRLLIGGLGVGNSLVEAIRTPGVTATVVELEPTVIGWHASHLKPVSQDALNDPRVTVVCDDLLSWLRAAPESFDAICLDIDNGPEWTVTDENAWLYTDDGLDLLARRLGARGVLAVWSAGASAAFEDRLRAHFTGVETHTIAVPRGEPDVVYLGRRR